MAEVFFNSAGNAELWDTESAQRREVPREQVQAALDAGMVPMSPDAVRQDALKKHYDRPVSAFLAGAGRTLTLGLSDVALTELDIAKPQTLRGLQQYSGTASAAGEIAGAAAGLISGRTPIGLAGRLGAKAGKAATVAAAKSTGRGVASVVPQLAGSVAREGVVGLAVGTGQAASDMALQRQEASLASLGAGALHGLALGGLFGAGGTLLGAGARAGVRQAEAVGAKLGFNTKRTKDLMVRHRELRDELDHLAKIPELADDAGARALQVEFEDISRKLIVDKMARVSGAIVGGLAIGGVPGAIVGTLAGPRVLEVAQKVMRPIWGRRETIGQAWDALGPEAVRAAGAARPAVYRYGPMALDVAYAIADPKKFFAKKAVEKVGKTAVSAAGAVAQRAAGAAGRVGRMETVRRLTAEDVAEAAQELQQADVADAEATIRMSAPSWAQPQHVDEMVGEAGRGLTYLKQHAPQRPPDAGDGWKPAKFETSDFSARLRGVVQPESVLIDFHRGELDPRTVDAVAVVHPAALQEMRRVFGAQWQRQRDAGVHHTAQQMRQAAMLLGDPSLAPRLEQPSVQAQMHMAFAQARQQSEGQPAPRGSVMALDIASRHQGRLQAALEGKV